MTPNTFIYHESSINLNESAFYFWWRFKFIQVLLAYIDLHKQLKAELTMVIKSIYAKKRVLFRTLLCVFWASCRIRTNAPEITNHVLWPTELKRQVGKLPISRRYNQLPLLRSRPGGFEGSWPYRTYPFSKCKITIKNLMIDNMYTFFKEFNTNIPIFNLICRDFNVKYKYLPF